MENWEETRVSDFLSRQSARIVCTYDDGRLAVASRACWHGWNRLSLTGWKGRRCFPPSRSHVYRLLDDVGGLASQWRLMYYAYPPPPRLAPFIHYFWYQSPEQSAAATMPAPKWVIPIGAPELVITLAGGDIYVSDLQLPHQRELSKRVPRMALRGAYSQWYRYAWQPTTTCLGAQFKPGGAAPFLPLPADETSNVYVDLEALWGSRATELYEQLQTAQTPAEQARLLAEKLIAQALSTQPLMTPLMSKAGRPLTHHPVVAHALQEFERASHPQAIAQTIAQVVEQSGLSHRYFNELFRAAIGLSPKRFRQLRRLRTVLRDIWREPPISWAAVALEHGYYDHAHLANDFRHFAGISPTAYLRNRSEGCYYLALDVTYDMRDVSTAGETSATP